ncbi:calcitonin gene-related peptide 1-like [Equus quagga]|uniref:calcitonin gene-related peptide 1-like n=1 Tax=Equus quagga TaxID=89248 RepID=UPI001EE1E14B|nr:calcitonin gene-related peptide 1-like [Equus quagga]
MGFWKFSTFLPLSILVLYQAGILQAASLGDMLESLQDPTILAEEETQLLLAGLVKEYMRLKALQQETEGYRVPAQKGSCNTATCVTQWLAGLLSSSGGGEKSNFVPTNVAPKSSGCRRRDLQA